MSTQTFRAFWVTETEDQGFQQAVIERHLQDLPAGEVTVKVAYSSLNYKDALSATGNKGVTRRYPHTPGIDAAGVVAQSDAPALHEGDEVIVTSYDLGMNTAGGFAEYIRVPAKWVVRMPPELDLKTSMILGTAGFTAGLALYKMERNGQQPEQGPVLVTGASGGVGSLAVGLLAKAGYEVIASTGTEAAHDMLKQLGAHQIEDRAFAHDESGRPLLRPQWAGAIDTVGGNTLATALKACQREGNVAACGLVASPKLESSVFPFILNGVNLLGVDSATFPQPVRAQIWQKLATNWRIPDLASLATTISMEELPVYIEKILAGKTMGRIVVAI